MTKTVFIEQQIISAVRGLLTGRVNEILGNNQFTIPIFEIGEYGGGCNVVPVITLTTCETTEKERVILQDCYSLSIFLTVPETPESDFHCYAYSGAISRAVYENPTLGGIAERVEINGKKYLTPKKANCGQEWGLVISLRVTVEGNTYDG
ncbi:MAG: hypothetical protein LBH44_01800 [Treponema sp.]|jgi:hypothetical protein|nr:hypothetical protein [Treponema sp.]